jgi:hypothetical protein
MTATAQAAKVAARVLALVQDGATFSAALDQVCGAGTYEQLAGELYDQLRARAGA